jgi:transposase
MYWKPIVNILDSGVNITLANARHVKNLPGKKTDKSDAIWLSDLLAHGLVKPSFIPPKDIDMLRMISRDRGNRVKMRSTEKNRIHKYLECANIKLSSVVSNVFGVTGMLILEALSKHHKDPKLLSQMAKGRLKSKVSQLELALESTD